MHRPVDGGALYAFRPLSYKLYGRRQPLARVDRAGGDPRALTRRLRPMPNINRARWGRPRAQRHPRAARNEHGMYMHLLRRRGWTAPEAVDSGCDYKRG